MKFFPAVLQRRKGLYCLKLLFGPSTEKVLGELLFCPLPWSQSSTKDRQGMALPPSLRIRDWSFFLFQLLICLIALWAWQGHSPAGLWDCRDPTCHSKLVCQHFSSEWMKINQCDCSGVSCTDLIWLSKFPTLYPSPQCVRWWVTLYRRGCFAKTDGWFWFWFFILFFFWKKQIILLRKPHVQWMTDSVRAHANILYLLWSKIQFLIRLAG